MKYPNRKHVLIYREQLERVVAMAPPYLRTSMPSCVGWALDEFLRQRGAADDEPHREEDNDDRD